MDQTDSVSKIAFACMTATCSPRFIVQLQHIVCKILSPTHCGPDTFTKRICADEFDCHSITQLQQRSSIQ